MYKKRLVAYGNSSALVINVDLLKMLDVVPRETFVDLRVEGDCLVVRRVGPRRRPSRNRAAYQFVEKLEALAAAGLSRELFQRISNDGKTLQEVASNLIHNVAVDPITIARIEECTERRQNCKESWDSTITAVLARRTREQICDDSKGDDDVSREGTISEVPDLAVGERVGRRG